MSEGLIGAVIGAAAAILGGIIGELIKFHFETRQINQSQMREAYELVERLLAQTKILKQFTPSSAIKGAS